MFDFTSKALTNSLKSNLDDALKSGKIIVSVGINGKEFPGKMYCRSSWVLGLNDTELKISNNRTKKVSKQISVSDINNIELSVAKGFNNAPGQFMRQTLCLEMAINIGETTYQLICEDLGAIQPILSWVQENNINFTDSYDLVKLYSENNSKEAVDILYSKIQEIQGR